MCHTEDKGGNFAGNLANHLLETRLPRAITDRTELAYYDTILISKSIYIL